VVIPARHDFFKLLLSCIDVGRLSLFQVVLVRRIPVALGFLGQLHDLGCASLHLLGLRQILQSLFSALLLAEGD
jgi:hypothetical protein